MLNRTLGPVGYELSLKNEHTKLLTVHNRVVEKLGETVKDVQKLFSDLIFPDLPSSDRRNDLLGNLIGTPVCEAMYIVGYLQAALSLPGDVCEFGVAQGATSALLANEISNTQKRLWLFDSFKGLPKPTQKDSLINDIFSLGSIEKYEGTMACDVSQVSNRLKEIEFPQSRIMIVPGFIEETVKLANLPKEVCFAYVDFDFYEPIKTALMFLSSRLTIGGSVVVDDYGFFSTGAKTAVDEFLSKDVDSWEMTFPMRVGSLSTPFCRIRRRA